MSQITENLYQMSESIKAAQSKCNPNLKKLFYSCPEDFVLQNGRDYTPKPLDKNKYKYGKVSQCFYNTCMLVLKFPELNYTEGFVRLNRGLTILHAWAVDNTDVIDNTLRWSKDDFPVCYRGIVFSNQFVIDSHRQKGYSFSLIGNWQEGFPLLQEKFTPVN
jgi:hypothetical protein